MVSTNLRGLCGNQVEMSRKHLGLNRSEMKLKFKNECLGISRIHVCG